MNKLKPYDYNSQLPEGWKLVPNLAIFQERIERSHEKNSRFIVNVIKAISKFPDSFSIDELVDKMILLDKIEKGLHQADKNQVISDDDLDKKIEEWLK